MRSRGARGLIAVMTCLIAVAVAAPAVSSAAIQPATRAVHHRPVAGTWRTCGDCATYYAVGTFRVSKGGTRVSNVTFRPNNGVLYCTPGKYTVIGSFKIRRGGLKGTKYHIGRKVGGAYQLNVSYKIGTKTQPTKTSLEIDFLSAKRAHIEFGPYATASCNMFWDMTHK